jgi:hypothetical protein
MELLLWLYIFDNRWLFDLKIKGNIYLILWIIPLLINFITFSFGLIYLILSKNFNENKYNNIDFKINDNDIYSNINTNNNQEIFHMIISNFFKIINIIIFIKKILYLNNKEKIEERKLVKANDTSNNDNNYDSDNFNINLHNSDKDFFTFSYWTRRNSALSLPGLILLIQSLIPFYFSFDIEEFFIKQNAILRFRLFEYKVFSLLINFKKYLILLDYFMIFLTFSILMVKFFNILFGKYFPKFYTKVFKFKKICHKKIKSFF